MRMIFSLILFSSIFLGDFFIADAFVGLGRAKVTVNVLDGAGNPIEGAKVKIGFYYVSGQGNVVAQDGLSDAEGKFTASSKSDRDVGGNVSIDGYYTSYFSYDFKGKEFGFWQPWNPIIDVVLRKKENPVPMYARDLTRTLKKLEIPIVGQDVGFDLSKFDWVTPYGIGTTPDFIFNLERTYKDRRDWDIELALTFTNQSDGIQLVKDSQKEGSDFRLPRYAPLEGYRKKLIINKTAKPVERGGTKITEDYSKDNNYIFRIRSEINSDGNLVRAMYGKMLNDLRIYIGDSDTAKIEFKYYLNPDYTRNLEFDTERNLFVNLPWNEQVRIK